MWHFQELFQDSKLMHYLKRRRMHGIPAKIAEEVVVPLENRDIHSRASQKIAQHHARRATTNHTARCFEFFSSHTLNGSLHRLHSHYPRSTCFSHLSSASEARLTTSPAVSTASAAQVRQQKIPVPSALGSSPLLPEKSIGSPPFSSHMAQRTQAPLAARI